MRVQGAKIFLWLCCFCRTRISTDSYDFQGFSKWMKADTDRGLAGPGRGGKDKWTSPRNGQTKINIEILSRADFVSADHVISLIHLKSCQVSQVTVWWGCKRSLICSILSYLYANSAHSCPYEPKPGTERNGTTTADRYWFQNTRSISWPMNSCL